MFITNVYTLCYSKLEVLENWLDFLYQAEKNALAIQVDLDKIKELGKWSESVLSVRQIFEQEMNHIDTDETRDNKRWRGGRLGFLGAYVSEL